ncbi:MAG: hypothetical protein JSW34_03370, partial [Candidatus Zixiibacteriota bacterium]
MLLKENRSTYFTEDSPGGQGLSVSPLNRVFKIQMTLPAESFTLIQRNVWRNSEEMDITSIQQYLAEQKLDGWLMADFHARNNVAVEMLGLSGIVTRRSFYFIPAMGEPSGI